MKLPRPTAKRIRKALDELAEDPDQEGLAVVPLKGRSGYRLRVGDYRVIFERDDKIRILMVERIAPRGDVYK